jgi:hypothetical protein
MQKKKPLGMGSKENAAPLCIATVAMETQFFADPLINNGRRIAINFAVVA